MSKDFKLCYIYEDGTAYFTTQELSEQWGDDWNDKPYECNAGEPYLYDKDYNKEEEPWEIYKLKFESPLETPYNLDVSVEEINTGRIAWLSSPTYKDEKINIYAGCSIEEFKKLIKKSGGTIYIKEE